MMLRYFGFSAVFCIACLSSQCQRIELNLRLGLAKQFVPNITSTEGFAYKLLAPRIPYPTLALELNKELRKAHTHLQVGVGMIPTFGEASMHSHNLSQGYGSTPVLVVYSYQLYGGIERRLGRSDVPPGRNRFSLFGGLAFSLSGEDYTRPVSSENYGLTKDGRSLEGVGITAEQSKYFAPALYGGIRHLIMNRKGKQVFAFELSGNFGLFRYYSTTVSYTLDGVPQKDFLAEKGTFIQFGIVKRLAKF